MKKLALTTLALGLMATSAFASDLEDQCVAYVTDQGGDPSGCSCLVDAADDAMTEELSAVQSEEDLATLSDASKEALAACFPS